MKYIVKKQAEYRHILKTETGGTAGECRQGEDEAYQWAAAKMLFNTVKEIEEGLRGAGHSTSTPEQCAGGTCHYCSVRRLCWAAIAAATPPRCKTRDETQKRRCVRRHGHGGPHDFRKEGT